MVHQYQHHHIHHFHHQKIHFIIFNKINNERRNSIVSDIHHLTHSPNTFETSMTSNSSSNSNKHQDTLSYLIEQNQRAMQRLISNHKENPIGSINNILFLSINACTADYESGPLTTNIK